LADVILIDQARREYAKRLIDAADTGDVVRIGKPTRSAVQNAKLWPMLNDIKRQVPRLERFSTDEIKDIFMNALRVELKYLPCLEGEGMFPVGMRTSTLTKAQFAGLIEIIYALGAREGVLWSEPFPA
jgi:hypothetical protein